MTSQMIDRWNIVSWYQEYDDGRLIHPFGENPEGFLDYQAAGYMCCTIVRPDRQNFTTGGQWNADDREKADAYNGYLSYSGTFEVVGNTVEHKVRYSIFPNWVGSVQKRTFELKGDILDLSARLEDGTAEARTAILRWSRDKR